MNRRMPIAFLLLVGVIVVALYLAMNLAVCGDGTFSLSRGERGACSGHGGLLR